jgi:cyclomaltodextrinase / maltogenic alpha-amylase / neopullulanase
VILGLTVTRQKEPAWGQHAIWWHLYPLGFLGAEPEAVAPRLYHRLPKLLDWIDYVVELGVSGILMGPVFSSSSHGYDTVDYFKIDSRLGDASDFAHLLEGAHRRGLHILLDGVFNHVRA